MINNLKIRKNNTQKKISHKKEYYQYSMNIYKLNDLILFY